MMDVAWGENGLWILKEPEGCGWGVCVWKLVGNSHIYHFFPIHLGVWGLMCGCSSRSPPGLRSVPRGSIMKICNVFVMRQLKNERLSRDGHDFWKRKKPFCYCEESTSWGKKTKQGRPHAKRNAVWPWMACFWIQLFSLVCSSRRSSIGTYIWSGLSFHCRVCVSGGNSCIC